MSQSKANTSIDDLDKVLKNFGEAYYPARDYGYWGETQSHELQRLNKESIEHLKAALQTYIDQQVTKGRLDELQKLATTFQQTHETFGEKRVSTDKPMPEIMEQIAELQQQLKEPYETD